MLAPVLALIVWSLLVWVLLYVRRLPAMSAAGMDPEEAKFPGTYGERLPERARAAADNYNHLMEQPTIFYALMFYLYLAGTVSPWATWLGWAYVVLRVLHTLVQVSVGRVVVRFALFALSTLCLFGLVGIALI